MSEETYEFIWTAEDLEDLLADYQADQQAESEIILDDVLDVWSYLQGWMAYQNGGQPQ
jgi:hypothetical protein